MNIIKTILCAIIFTSTCLAQPITLPWNIVIYMEATGGHLYQAAFKNLNEMAHNAPDDAHIFAFLHTQGSTGWLYHITKNNFHKIAEIMCDDSQVTTLIDVMTITTQQGPAIRYGLIFWDHGYGILNPVYNEQENEHVIPYDGPYNDDNIIKRSQNKLRQYYRGICVSNKHNFLSNEDMIYALDIICKNLLNGKKLAFCGMDICYGAMFEHAYQLYNYTDYLIASQDVEKLDGWPYDTVLQIISDTPNTPTKEIAIHTVNAFNQYYQEYTEQITYTLSALDLNYTQKLKNNIDTVSNMLISMLIENIHVKKMLKQLRKQCKTFCDAPMYCDLYQWYSKLLDAFDKCSGIDKQSDLNILFRQTLLDGLELMSAMTVARCNDSESTHAHGCSIYFPQFAVNESYITSLFAQESSWVQFLEQFLA